MAQLPGAFNAGEHEGMQNFDAIPAGKYIAFIEKSEKKEAKTQGNFYWQLSFKIQSDVDGGTNYKNRIVWARLNLVNSSAQAVEIANNELSDICRAAGKINIQDTAELHNIPMLIDVRQTPATPQYPAGNVIKGYDKMEGLASVPPPLAAEPSAPEEPRKRAWEE